MNICVVIDDPGSDGSQITFYDYNKITSKRLKKAIDEALKTNDETYADFGYEYDAGAVISLPAMIEKCVHIVTG